MALDMFNAGTKLSLFQYYEKMPGEPTSPGCGFV